MLAVQVVTLVVVCAVAALVIAAWRASRQGTDLSPLLLQLGAIEKALDRSERALREELARGRAESSEAARQLRGEVGARIFELSAANENRFESLRKSVEDRLRHLQEDNTAKLELMRQTVDEKLQGTLEQRLGESFKLVSERLEQVYRGLGEMQKLAGGVDDLKKVLTNVKTRGNWGEMQLDALLEQVLAPEQYERNVATSGTAERVDFAIRLPGRDVATSVVWLPIDAKFPQDDYQRLVEASEQSNPGAMEDAAKALEARLRLEAKRIHHKYVDPPQTTDFAILFLPTEGLYAEALRRPGLADLLQRDFKVAIAGPTTLCALLNSLQMGFRTLAIQKQSGEVWRVLGEVKTQFRRYAGVLGKVKEKIQQAGTAVEDAERKTQAIEKKLRDVEVLAAPPGAQLPLNAAEPEEAVESLQT
ncbi:MAG: DNA recombination protein RmuC [Bryobacteraceae bacterium]|jgi:DNA recombination protein RmuC